MRQVAEFEQLKRNMELLPPTLRKPESWNDAEANRTAWLAVRDLIHDQTETEPFEIETLENLHRKQMQQED
jgi:hypothetical protein